MKPSTIVLNKLSLLFLITFSEITSASIEEEKFTKCFGLNAINYKFLYVNDLMQSDFDNNLLIATYNFSNLTSYDQKNVVWKANLYINQKESVWKDLDIEVKNCQKINYSDYSLAIVDVSHSSVLIGIHKDLKHEQNEK